MIAVIFEVWPKVGRKQAYLDIAAELKPELEKIDGFLSIERFQSLGDETKILSLSFFRDEAAVKAWRNVQHHRKAQQAGRSGIFRDYRLRVASVMRDYGMTERDQAPADLRATNG
jgi:heme-degrading monooxygenase HmoA